MRRCLTTKTKQIQNINNKTTEKKKINEVLLEVTVLRWPNLVTLVQVLGFTFRISVAKYTHHQHFQRQQPADKVFEICAVKSSRTKELKTRAVQGRRKDRVTDTSWDLGWSVSRSTELNTAFLGQLRQTVGCCLGLCSLFGASHTLDKTTTWRLRLGCKADHYLVA